MDALVDYSAEDQLEARKLSSRALGIMMLRKRPDAAQTLLASTSAAQCRELVEESINFYRDGGATVSAQANWQILIPFLLVFVLLFVFFSKFVVF